MNAAPPLVELSGISKSFGAARVLDGVGLSLRAGEVHVLAGENGAGKSTLMKILCGVHRADAGTISISGSPRSFHGPRDAEQAGIAMIHQELSLAPSMSVLDNLFLGMEPTRCGFLRRGEERRAAAATLARVGLRVDPRTSVGSLPISLRQVVEIAKALLRRARLLIMDEPTSSLDRPEAERLFELVHELKSNPVHPAAIVYITHRMDEIYRLADRITVLRDGRLVISVPTAELPKEALIRAMVGRVVTEAAPATDTHAAIGVATRAAPTRAPTAGSELLRLSRVKVTSERTALVHDLSLTLHRGEVIAIAGLQGSGAGSLLRALFAAGTARVTAGEVAIGGRTARISSPRHAMRLGIALVTEDRKATGLCQGLGIGANLMLPSLAMQAQAGWRRRAWERAGIAGAMTGFGVKARGPSQESRTLSGGNQQKVVLAKWLLREPSILLLNDPTRGVDVGAREEIYGIISQATRRGAGVLVAGSDLDELVRLGDRVIVLHRGCVTADLVRGDAAPHRVLAAAMGDAA